MSAPLQVIMARHLGDAVLALPALRLLAQATPIVAIADGVVAELLSATCGMSTASWSEICAAPAVLLARSLRAAVVARRAGATLRIGFAGDGRRLLLTHVVPHPTDALPGPVLGRRLPALLCREHQADAYVRVARHALGVLGLPAGAAAEPALVPSAADEEAGERAWRSAGEPQVVLHPCAAGAATKRWSEARWVSLASTLERCVVTGGPSSDDDALVTRIGDQSGALGLAGANALPIGAWAAFAARAGTVVTVDTGVGHVARAAGVRTVSLFGSTDPARHRPRGPGDGVLLHGGDGLSCSPCYRAPCAVGTHACAARVTVDAVAQAVRSAS